MKFEYRDATSNRLLDTVVLTGTKARYQTGKAKDLVEGVLRMPGGVVQAEAQFKSWSNGYVSTSEIVS